MKNKVTYLDYNATTIVDNRVVDTVVFHLREVYGNASSSYLLGMQAAAVIKGTRERIANFIGVEANEIYFTSGATESINLALKGLTLNAGNNKKHIVTCVTEHKAVLESCRYLESVGYEVDYLPVNKDGSLDLELLKYSIKADTLLICLMWINNETGVIYPVKEIGKIAKEAGVYFVCDGTQGVGKIPIDVLTSNIDVFCFSGHKMYAPKGIGGVYINKLITKQNKIQPLIHGGGQENGLRSGTYNVPLIAGLGKAFEIAEKEMEENREQIERLRKTLEQELSKIEEAFINGTNAERSYNTVNVCIPGFDTEIFIGMNKDIAISNGSACNAALMQPSHVLLGMGLTNEDAMSSIRISLGKENTQSDIDLFMERIYNFMSIQ